MKRRAFIRSVGSALAVSAMTRISAQDAPEFDYVIVGAGSAGCVVADRLSADGKTRVLLLEAGPAGDDPAIDLPARWVSLIGSSYDWNYETEAAGGLAGRAVRWPRGRVVGGSSAINAMAYVCGHPSSFEAWARAAGDEWSYRRVLPIFRSLERNSRGASEFHGDRGPLAVSDCTDPHAGHFAFLEAAREHGFDASPTWDFNGARQENGAGFYQKNILDGRRHSAADAFLTPAQSRPNLTVWTGTTARRLIIERGRVVAIEVRRSGARDQRVQVAREVVLSSGVIESPKLLMLSGIGPAAALKTIGVPVIADAPEVGANLHDHPRVSIRWASRQPLAGSSVSAGLFVHSRGNDANTLGDLSGARRTGDAGSAGPSGTAGAGSVGSADGAGRADGRDNAASAGGVGNAGAPTDGRVPDLQFYVGRGLDTVDEFITLTVAVCAPHSRGSLMLRSANPDERPVIRTGYFTDARDLDALVEGVQLARALASTKAYATLRGAAIDPRADEESPDALRAFIRRAADTIFHPVGTCRMGTDSRAVVDPTLRVRGIENLRVADGSVMPVSVNSQTHAACLLIGAKAAEFILSGSR